jgi:hypothetical protein
MVAVHSAIGIVQGKVLKWLWKTDGGLNSNSQSCRLLRRQSIIREWMNGWLDIMAQFGIRQSPPTVLKSWGSKIVLSSSTMQCVEMPWMHNCKHLLRVYLNMYKGSVNVCQSWNVPSLPTARNVWHLCQLWAQPLYSEQCTWKGYVLLTTGVTGWPSHTWEPLQDMYPIHILVFDALWLASHVLAQPRVSLGAQRHGIT